MTGASEKPAAPREGEIKVSRRGVLVGGAALVVGLTATGLLVSRRPSRADPLSAYLDVSPSGEVTVYVGQLEMGQGTSTGLAMMVADELGAEWSSVGVEFVANDPAFIHPLVYNNEQVTGGSASIVGFGMPMRKAAAAAREMLIAVAAERLEEPVDVLRSQDGEIRSLQTGRTVPFSELIETARKQSLPEDPPLKDAADFTIVGRPTVRLDARSKVEGRPVFGIDVDLPDMMYAAVRQSPSFGGDADVIRDVSARQMPGVLGIYRIPNGIACVAEQYWQARQALEAVEVTWSKPEPEWSNSDEYRDALISRLDTEDGVRVGSDEGVSAFTVDAPGHQSVSATYDVPFLAHATMEPMNATAHVQGDSIEVWAPTQTVTLDQVAVADALGVDPDNVKVNLTYAGGGFGRRGSSEYVVQAALLSRAAGRPVKVIWSREEDTRQDFYRPAFAAKLDGTISDDGDVSALDIKVCGPGVWSYNRPLLVQRADGVDELAVEGAYGLRYAIPQTRLRHVAINPLQRVGYWRSIGYSHNIFFVESFLDELAHSVGADPFQMRHALLSGDDRSQAVLTKAAEEAGWFDPRPADRFLGIAFFAADRWQCRVAQVADVSLDGETIRVNRMVCVADVGQAINPLSVEAQLQGAVLFALSAALYGQIDIEDGAIVQSSFTDYQVLTLRDAPPVDVAVIQGADQPGLVGEIGVPCAAPALCNAIYAATGERIRSLPIRKHELV